MSLRRLPTSLNTVLERPIFSAIFSMAVLFFVYALLSCRDFYWDDAAEFVYISKTIGIAHPSGYPLYSLLSFLAVRIPPYDGWSLALLSALFMSAASGVLVRLLIRLGLAPLQAIGLVLFTLLSPVAVDMATIPEVYSLHFLLMCLIADRATAWKGNQKTRNWLLLWLFIGLGFANHLTTFWVLAPIALYLWQERKSILNGRMLGLAMGMLVLGLLPYAYLPLLASTNPLWNHGNPDNVGRLISHISGDIFRYRLFTLSGEEVFQQVRDWAHSLSGQWSIPALFLILPGAWRIWKNARSWFWPLVLWLGVGLVYTWNYYIPDKGGYYLVLHVILGIGIGLGLGMLLDGVALKKKTGVAVFIKAMAILVVAFTLLWRATDHNTRSFTALTDFATDTWNSIGHDTILITEDLNLHYATQLLQQNGDIPKKAVVVSQYLLIFPWYHDYLSRRYPELKLPENLQQRAEAFAAGELDSGRKEGSRRQRLVEAISHDLIVANPEKEVAIYRMNNTDEPDELFGFRLQMAGLAYKVLKDGAKEQPRACDFANKYRIGKMAFSDPWEIWLAGRYATACNRSGIALSKSGKPEDAITALDRAFQYDPNYAQALKNKGLILVKDLGRKSEGRKVWKRYLELAGDDADPGIRKWMAGSN